jgi:hypothetical protein
VKDRPGRHQLPDLEGRDTILLPPGNRVEVLVQPDRRGVYELKSLPHDQGHPGGPRPGVLLATVASTGRRVREPTRFPLPLIPTQMPDISRNRSTARARSTGRARS